MSGMKVEYKADASFFGHAEAKAIEQAVAPFIRPINGAALPRPGELPLPDRRAISGDILGLETAPHRLSIFDSQAPLGLAVARAEGKEGFSSIWTSLGIFLRRLHLKIAALHQPAPGIVVEYGGFGLGPYLYVLGKAILQSLARTASHESDSPAQKTLTLKEVRALVRDLPTNLDPQKIAILKECLSSDQPDIRTTALSGLGIFAKNKTYFDEVYPTLRALLEDPRPEIRRQAATAMAWYKNTATLGDFVRLTEDRDPSVSKVAVLVLAGFVKKQEPGASPYPEALNALKETLRLAQGLPFASLKGERELETSELSREEVVSTETLAVRAAEALGESRDPSVVEELLFATQSKSEKVRLAALEALIPVGLAHPDPRSVDIGQVVPFLQETNVQILMAAVQVLFALRNPDATISLINLVGAVHNSERPGYIEVGQAANIAAYSLLRLYAPDLDTRRSSQRILRDLFSEMMKDSDPFYLGKIPLDTMVRIALTFEPAPAPSLTSISSAEGMKFLQELSERAREALRPSVSRGLPSAEESLLIARLEKVDPAVRLGAIYHTVLHGSLSMEALDLSGLIPLLKYPDPEVRRLTVMLLALTKEARFLPNIRASQRDPEAFVRDVAEIGESLLRGIHYPDNRKEAQGALNYFIYKYQATQNRRDVVQFARIALAVVRASPQV